MNAARKLGMYAAGLGVVFAATFGAGSVADPIGLSNAEPETHSGAMDEGSGLPGLATAADELSIHPAVRTITPGAPTTYEFSIRDDNGVVTEFDVEHTKRMHLIVVRRDFAGFIHDHPTMASDGTWATTLEIDDPGTYRVFADFVIDGDKHTLGTDLFVPGDFQPSTLARPTAEIDVDDDYSVEIDGDVIAGQESEIEFTVRRNGRVITDIPDYLGAKGHLVALRDGDLAYLHVHADEERLTFEADFPTPGAYRLFLQFNHDDEVRTAAFTVDAKEATR